jgi:hypothetical protein
MNGLVRLAELTPRWWGAGKFLRMLGLWRF